MPTTSDLLAQQADTQAGGSAVPQSDTNAVARALLGDATVEQFGDVIGARPTGFKDVLRDFAIGAARGPEALEQIKGLQRKAYSDALFRQQQAALARKKADIAQAGAVLDTYKKVQGMPAGARASLLKSQLESIGITPDPAALKLMLNGDILAQLPMQEIMDAHQREEISTANLQEVFGSAKGAIDFVTGMTRAAKDRQSVDSIALDILRKGQEAGRRERDIFEETTGIPQNRDPDIAADPRKAVAREIAAREQGVAGPDQPFFPQFQGMSDEKVRKLAKQNLRKQARIPGSGTKKTGNAGILQDAKAFLGRGGEVTTSSGNVARKVE